MRIPRVALAMATARRSGRTHPVTSRAKPPSTAPAPRANSNMPYMRSGSVAPARRLPKTGIAFCITVPTVVEVSAASTSTVRMVRWWRITPSTLKESVARVGDPHEEQGQRQVERHVDEDAHGRAEHHEQDRTDHRPEEHPEGSERRVDPHRRGQRSRAREVVQHHLLRRRPQGEGAGGEQDAPRDRDGDEQPLSDLDEPPAVVPLRQRAGVHR